jgi:hypothetical protein
MTVAVSGGGSSVIVQGGNSSLLVAAGGASGTAAWPPYFTPNRRPTLHCALLTGSWGSNANGLDPSFVANPVTFANGVMDIAETYGISEVWWHMPMGEIQGQTYCASLTTYLREVLTWQYTFWTTQFNPRNLRHVVYTGSRMPTNGLGNNLNTGAYPGIVATLADVPFLVRETALFRDIGFRRPVFDYLNELQDAQVIKEFDRTSGFPEVAGTEALPLRSIDSVLQLDHRLLHARPYWAQRGGSGSGLWVNSNDPNGLMKFNRHSTEARVGITGSAFSGLSEVQGVALLQGHVDRGWVPGVYTDAPAYVLAWIRDTSY